MRGQSTKRQAPCQVGIDLMGSDIPPLELLKAVLNHARELPSNVHICLFGIDKLKGRVPREAKNVKFIPFKQVIYMDDDPLVAIRRKKESTMCTGIRMLKEGAIQAFISAGNTGALMACAKLSLPDLPNVERPALLTLIPSQSNEIAVLDVGANTTYKAKHLIQFAAMGIAYQRSRGIAKPKVGLLNIGSEAKKGTPELQEAYNYLFKSSKKAGFTFAGNVEGRDVFHKDLDVLVTDGFTGNVFLKTAEGIATVILEELEKTSAEGCSDTLKTLLSTMRHRMHYAEYPGALLCGIDGIVIKCHGNASPESVARSITSAARLIEHDFLNRVRQELK